MVNQPLLPSHRSDFLPVQLAQPMGSRLRGEPRIADIRMTHADRYYLKGNLQRILASIRIAKEQGATLRVGPELEITLVHRLSILIH